MNIYVVAKGFPPEVGGIEEYSRAIYLSLKEILNGQVNAYVFLTECKEQADFIYIKKSKIEIVNFLRLFYFILKNKNADTIFWVTTWKVALPIFLLQKRYIVTAHGNEFLRSEFLLNKLMNRVYNKAEKIICVSNYTREKLISKFNYLKTKNVVVAHNGISKKCEKSISKTSKNNKYLNFYSICRLEKRKNIKTAIVAFEKFVRKNSIRARFRIAGTGSEEENLKSLVQEMSLSEDIQFYGYMNDDDLVQLHTSSDIFLHPNIELNQNSDVEGFGLVVADAAACGNIPIVGKSGGTKEIVEVLNYGYAIDGNNVDEIVKAMEDCLTDGFTDDDRIKRKNKAMESFMWKKHVLEAIRGL